MPRVVVELDGKAVAEAPDGVAYVREIALRDIRLRYRYDEGEMAAVARDPVLNRSCESAYLRVRDRASTREWRDAKMRDRYELARAKNEGREAGHYSRLPANPSSAPFRWSVPIHFSRPETRGRFGGRRE